MFRNKKKIDTKKYGTSNKKETEKIKENSCFLMETRIDRDFNKKIKNYYGVYEAFSRTYYYFAYRSFYVHHFSDAGADGAHEKWYGPFTLQEAIADYNHFMNWAKLWKRSCKQSRSEVIPITLWKYLHGFNKDSAFVKDKDYIEALKYIDTLEGE